MIRRGCGASLFSPGDEVRLIVGKTSVAATVVHADTKGISIVTAARELWWIRNSDFAKRLRVMGLVRQERKPTSEVA